MNAEILAAMTGGGTLAAVLFALMRIFRNGGEVYVKVNPPSARAPSGDGQ